jgi:hypothetical protein
MIRQSSQQVQRGVVRQQHALGQISMRLCVRSSELWNFDGLEERRLVALRALCRRSTVSLCRRCFNTSELSRLPAIENKTVDVANVTHGVTFLFSIYTSRPAGDQTAGGVGVPCSSYLEQVL